MEGSAKETVIIVHGTWAVPKAGTTRWYQPVYGAPSIRGFVDKLDGALTERGSPARCWAHCCDASNIFHWSGENDWVARTNAALELKEYIVALQQAGWRCHIVAHSHGGNVVAQAISDISARLDAPPGKIVTLGTPFIDTTSPILRRAERKRRTVEIAAWMAIAILFLAYTYVIYWAFWDVPAAVLRSLRTDYPALLLIAIYVLTAAAIIWLIRRRYRQMTERRFPSSETPEKQPEFLAMSSLMDEPWQILHHMRNSDNPLAVGSNPLRYVSSILKASISNNTSIARIRGAKTYRDFGRGGQCALLIAHLLTGVTVLAGLVFVFAQQEFRDVVAGLGTTGLGAAIELAELLLIFIISLFLASGVIAFCVVAFFTNRLGHDFYSAYSSPFRWCAHRVGCMKGVFTALATYMLRRKTWSFLQTIAMGLEGYGYELPGIEQSPTWVPARFIRYETMPDAAERRALKARTDWVGLHLADVSQAFAKIAITAADINSLLRMVEADQSLVHGAYYTDDECIARIADWIAGKG